MKRFNQYSDETKVAYFEQVSGKMSGDKVNLTGPVSGSATFNGSGEINVETTLSLPPYPDLHIPFNDGLRIESGYGTQDQIDVSAAQDGSVMVDLPSKSADLTRSTGCYYINKSGLIDYADVDEPAIASGGILLHKSLTNYILSSGDSSNAAYWTQNSAVSFGTSDTGIGLSLNYVIPTATTANHWIRQQTSATGTDFTVTFITKSDSSSNYNSFRLDVRDGTDSSNSTRAYGNTETGEWSSNISISGTASNYKLSSMTLGDYVAWSFSVGFSASVPSINIILAVTDSFGGNTNYTGDGSTGIYVGQLNLYQGGSAPIDLVVPTTDSTSVIGATACTVPVEGNIPAAGESFTIACDVDIPNSSAIAWCADSSSVFTLLRSSLGNNVAFRYDDSLGVIKTITVPYEYTTGVKRYVVTYNKESLTLSIYCNGDLCDSSVETEDTAKNLQIFDSTNISIGGPALSNHLNSTVKNFKAYHYALTAEQVAALGEAE